MWKEDVPLGTKLLQCIITELRKQTSPVLTVNFFFQTVGSSRTQAEVIPDSRV